MNRFKNSKIKHIKNFPITLVVKGINQFVKNHKSEDDESMTLKFILSIYFLIA